METGMGIRIIMEDMITNMKKKVQMVGPGCRRVLAAMAIVLAGGCVSGNYDLSSTPPYQGQVGGVYELAEDSYIVTLREMDELFLVNRYSAFYQPLPVESKYMGKSTEDINIKGVIPKGTVLKVAAIRGSESFDAGHTVEYFLEMGRTAAEPRLRLNACFLEERKGAVYRLDGEAFIQRGVGDKAGGGKL
jgi:hypothetical protein